MVEYQALATEEREAVSGFRLCFKDCTILYNEEEILDTEGTSLSLNSERGGIFTRAKHKVAKLGEPSRINFEACNFIPPSSATKENVEKYVKKNIRGSKIKFENSRFVPRDMNWFEMLCDLFHSCLGYDFQTFVSNTGEEAVMNGKTVRLRSLKEIVAKVQETAAEEQC